MQSVLASGLERYCSRKQLDVLAAAQVGIIGAGGLGSNVAVMLARSGIRHMTIADKDIVEPSNLNRQCYWPEDVGVPKVEALARRLSALEPTANIVTHKAEITEDNAAQLFAHCTIIVEAVDGASTKAMLYALFAPEKGLYVTASGMAGTGFSEEHPMISRKIRSNVVAVGDFTSAVSDDAPPLAPRVMQAAALQADAVLSHLLQNLKPS